MLRRRYTGPSATVRYTVGLRAQQTCEWPDCGQLGTEIHHRLNRKMGGRHGKRREEINQPAWLLLACHTHHKMVTSPSGPARVAARLSGWVLSENEDAETAAVHTFHGWVVLDNRGEFMEVAA